MTIDKGLGQCDKCDYFISVEEAYRQGKTDALEECLEMIKSHSNDDKLMNEMYVEWFEEWLKGGAE